MNEKTQEPSMEDILASIRKILSEDEEEEVKLPEPHVPAPAAAPVAVAVAPPPPVAEPVADDELELTDTLTLHDEDEDDEEPLLLQPAPEPPPSHAVPEPEPDLDDWGLSPEPEELMPMTFSEPMEPLPPLISEPAEAVSTAAFSQLAKAVEQADVTSSHRGPTVEDLTRELLRPIIKQWLDAHLPDLVERMVRREIQRLVSGAERK